MTSPETFSTTVTASSRTALLAMAASRAQEYFGTTRHFLESFHTTPVFDSFMDGACRFRSYEADAVYRATSV